MIVRKGKRPGEYPKPFEYTQYHRYKTDENLRPPENLSFTE